MPINICECPGWDCELTVSITDEQYSDLVDKFGLFGFRVYHRDCKDREISISSQKMVLIMHHEDFLVYLVPWSYKQSLEFISKNMFNFWR